MATDQANQDAFARLRNLLKNNLGLDLGKGPNSLDNRLWKQIQGFGGEENAMMLWLYEQPEFNKRFPALATLKAQNRAITPGEYMRLEAQYRSVMKSSGVPTKFFDKPDDFTKLIEGDINPDEFRDRLVDGYDKVAKTDPLVRQAFKNYFGVEGDAALAAYFIDPEKSTPELLRQAQEAQIGGAAQKTVGDIDYTYASRLAEMGVSYKQAMDSFTKLSSMSALFETGIGENTIGNQQEMEFVGRGPNSSFTVSADTKGELAVDLEFGVNQENRRQLMERLGQREAQFEGESQVATVNKQGETNIGSAF